MSLSVYFGINAFLYLAGDVKEMKTVGTWIIYFLVLPVLKGEKIHSKIIIKIYLFYIFIFDLLIKHVFITYIYIYIYIYIYFFFFFLISGH